MENNYNKNDPVDNYINSNISNGSSMINNPEQNMHIKK